MSFRTIDPQKNREITGAVPHWTARDLSYIAIMAGLIAICSWIAVPTTVPFTLQTFGVFLAVGTLGGSRGSCSVLVYLLLGLVGFPVFASFTGGAGALLGASGGYLTGFLFAALTYWLITSLLGNRRVVMFCAMLLGLIVCYAFGTAWFLIFYARSNGSPTTLFAALSWCVFPFIIPDLIKIIMAMTLSRILRPYVR